MPTIFFYVFLGVALLFAGVKGYQTSAGVRGTRVSSVSDWHRTLAFAMSGYYAAAQAWSSANPTLVNRSISRADVAPYFARTHYSGIGNFSAWIDANGIVYVWVDPMDTGMGNGTSIAGLAAEMVASGAAGIGISTAAGIRSWYNLVDAAGDVTPTSVLVATTAPIPDGVFVRFGS